MSLTLDVQFKISLGRKRAGHIRIDRPDQLVEFSRKDITPLGVVPATLSGAWYGFPRNRIERMEVMSTVNETELKWFNVKVAGNCQGDFSGEIYFDQEHLIAPVRLVGFDSYGRQVFTTSSYKITLRMLDNLPTITNK